MVSIVLAIYVFIGFVTMVWISSSSSFEEEVEKAFPVGTHQFQIYFNLFVTYCYLVVAWPYILYTAAAASTLDIE